MGRKRIPSDNFQAKRKFTKASFETRKNRHRFSDSKYRHNVHCLFELLKNQLNGTKTKDSTLSGTLDHIKCIENEIFNQTESAHSLDEHQKQFFNLLSIEETVWKEEKNVLKWWHKMQECLEPLHTPKVTDTNNLSDLNNDNPALQYDLLSTSFDFSEFQTENVTENVMSSYESTPYSSYHETVAAHESELSRNSCLKQENMSENLWSFQEEENLVEFKDSQTLNGIVENSEMESNKFTLNSDENSESLVADSFLESDPLTSFESSFQNIPSLISIEETSDDSSANESNAKVDKDFEVNSVQSYEPKQISVINQPFYATEWPLENSVVHMQGLNLAQQNFLPAPSIFYVL